MGKFRGLITNFLRKFLHGKSIGACLGFLGLASTERTASPREVIRQRILANFDYDKFYTGFIETANIINRDPYDWYPTMSVIFQYFDKNLPRELLPQDIKELEKLRKDLRNKDDALEKLIKDLRTPPEKLIIEIRKRVNVGTYGGMAKYAHYEAGLRCYFARFVSDLLSDEDLQDLFVEVLEQVYTMLLKNRNDLGRNTLDV